MYKYLNLNESIIQASTILGVYVLNNGAGYDTVVATNQTETPNYRAGTFNTEKEALEYKDKIFKMLEPENKNDVHGETFNFAEAAKLLLNGQNVRIKDWPEGVYIDLERFKNTDRIEFDTPVFIRSVTSNDWEIYKEEK